MQIKFESVNHVYNANTPMEQRALYDINFEIKEGQFLSVVGHTGSGKSTLIQHMNGLLKPSSGSITIGEKVIKSDNGLLSTVAWKIHDEVKYALEGSIFVSGSLIQWLRDSLHLFEKASDTEQMACSVKDSNGIIIVPSFTGLGAPYWVKECKGAIYSLTRGARPEHLTRAALEALAYQSKDLVEVMEADTSRRVMELKVDGGASQNDFLCQFQSMLFFDFDLILYKVDTVFLIIKSKIFTYIISHKE